MNKTVTVKPCPHYHTGLSFQLSVYPRDNSVLFLFTIQMNFILLICSLMSIHINKESGSQVQYCNDKIMPRAKTEVH